MTTTRFIKVLDEDFSSHLEIPKRDLACLRDNEWKCIYLIGPLSTKLSRVRVKSGRNSFLLKRGWRKFVKENKLQRNDTLYFSFREYGIFKVTVFDKLGRKIKGTESDRQIVDMMNEKERTRERTNGRERMKLNTETGGPSCEIGKKRVSEAECSHRHPKRGRTKEQTNATDRQILDKSNDVGTNATDREILDESNDVGSFVGNAARDKGKQIAEESRETDESDQLSIYVIESSEENDSVQEIPKEPEIISLGSSSSSSSSLMSRDKLPSRKKEVESSEESDSEAEPSEDSDSDCEIGRKKARNSRKIQPKKQRRILKSNRKDKEREKAKRRAENKSEPNSSDYTFMKVIDTIPGHKYYLNIPAEFGRRNLPRKSTYVTLRLPENEKEWEVHCPYTFSASDTTNKTSTQWRLSTGWNNFKVENNLKDGDTCLFELNRDKHKSEKTELIVQICRFSE